MPAIDTVVGKVTNAGAALTAVTFASGDSGVVRNFGQTDAAYLERITRAGASSGAARVLSPLLHDNVRGITFTSAETPTHYLMPQQRGESLRPQDTLTVQCSGGAAETDLVALSVYYTNLPGATARLHSWADIMPLIAHIKPMEVDCTNSATIGSWTDTIITATENLLKANTDYAVLGYVCDISQAMVGIKGQETNNLRICGPGTTLTDTTSNFFVEWSQREQTPHIPVFNAANAGNTYVSTCDVVASSTPKVQLILAQLSSNLPS
jgi:hypothetical protein